MLGELRKIPVFVARDFRILFTYRVAFFTFTLSILFVLFNLVLFGSMFGSADIPVLSAYGGDFISFIFVGSIGWAFLWNIMNATSESLRTEMLIGTLESILLTRTKIPVMVLSYALSGCIFGLFSIIILMLVGFFVFGITIFASATIYTLIILILSMILMLGFGLIFAGLTIWLKNIGDAVPVLQNVVMFFCGVYFPISVLPTFFQPIANFMPFYYSIEGLRRSLIPSTPESEMLFYVVVLLSLSILFIVAGIIILNKGLAKAKKDGSLAFY